jgi:hypothetical protein
MIMQLKQYLQKSFYVIVVFRCYQSTIANVQLISLGNVIYGKDFYGCRAV